MSEKSPNAFQAASLVLTWMRAINDKPESPATDLDLVRNLLPGTPFGKGVKKLLPPMPVNVGSFEGSLVRNPEDHAVWGILHREHPTARSAAVAVYRKVLISGCA